MKQRTGNLLISIAMFAGVAVILAACANPNSATGASRGASTEEAKDAMADTMWQAMQRIDDKIASGDSNKWVTVDNDFILRLQKLRDEIPNTDVKAGCRRHDQGTSYGWAKNSTIYFCNVSLKNIGVSWWWHEGAHLYMRAKDFAYGNDSLNLSKTKQRYNAASIAKYIAE